MMQRYIYILIFVSACVSNLSLLEAKTIHALVVCDTAEYQIGISAQRDCEKIQSELVKAAQFSGMKLNLQKLTWRDAQPRKVISVLDKLDVKSSDAIVFYFTGHGYHPEDKLGSRWPYLYFSAVRKVLPLQRIVDAIKKKKPRLALVFSDSCNTYLDTGLLGDVVYGKSALAHPVKEYMKMAGYKQLFLNAEGLLIATAAAEGGVAHATDDGGFFTQTLLTTLQRTFEIEKVKPKEVTWIYVLMQVREAMICQNRPIPDFHFESLSRH